MLVEILVFRGQERRLDQIGDGLDRQIEPPLARMLRHQLPVGRMDARHHGRLVLRQLVDIGQIGVERLQQSGHPDKDPDTEELCHPLDNLECG